MSGAKTSVVVLGGGVGGLSAAHELAERGFAVTVYERNDCFGGKARSLPVPNSATEGRRELPAEHGFRFFPGFYKHLPDTMRRIPYGSNPNGVADNLVIVKKWQIARAGDSELHFTVHSPRNRHDWVALMQALVDASELGIPVREAMFYARRLFMLLTSSDERRLAEYESIPWWDFIDAANKSDAYRKYFATGLTRTLVAMRAASPSPRRSRRCASSMRFASARGCPTSWTTAPTSTIS
jgi:15-cis-phytoene desaturase